MKALQRRRKSIENWELENQRQLLQLISVAQEAGKRNIVAAARLISFLLYLVYRGLRWSMGLLRAVLVCNQGLQSRLQMAEKQRHEHNSHPSLWLK